MPGVNKTGRLTSEVFPGAAPMSSARFLFDWIGFQTANYLHDEPDFLPKEELERLGYLGYRGEAFAALMDVTNDEELRQWERLWGAFARARINRPPLWRRRCTLE